MSRIRVDQLVQESRIYEDIHLDHRDAMYRAMTFIAQQGGPDPAGDAKEVLIAHREQVQKWLLTHEDLHALWAAYECFLARWSPVFLD